LKALEAAKTLPDLIILDVHLPDFSGFEICQQIKRDPRTRAIAVLQISAAFVAPEDRVRALDAGADGYLTHPIDRMVLLATVRALLRLKSAEATARSAANQWEAIFNGLDEGLALVDAQGRIARWNASFARICSTSAAPEPAQDANIFLEQLVGTSEPLRRPAHGQFSTEFSLEGKTIQLSVCDIESDEAGAGKIIIVSDVTHRKLAEYALRTAEKLAATGKLANAIAHEINNPLEAITNLLFLARSSTSLEFIQEMLTNAAAQMERVARITKQTLAFHRDSEHPIPIDVGGLVEEVAGMYSRSAGVRRVRVLCERQPALMVSGFPGQLTQVFGNLIRNATEAAPPDSAITVRVRPVHRGGRTGVSVVILDRGRGIPTNIKMKMFDPFFTTKDLKGSGLGLWVSKRIIAKHDGTIRFRSSERIGASGTVFEVFLPTIVVPAVAELSPGAAGLEIAASERIELAEPLPSKAL
jgi:signal transduction histidine kinase